MRRLIWILRILTLSAAFDEPLGAGGPGVDPCVVDIGVDRS